MPLECRNSVVNNNNNNNNNHDITIMTTITITTIILITTIIITIIIIAIMIITIFSSQSRPSLDDGLASLSLPAKTRLSSQALGRHGPSY